MSRAKFRAKTGCFTCRRRRVKCGEEKPSCRNCSIFGRQCDWPAPNDLYDRRSRSCTRPTLSSFSTVPDENQQQSLPESSCKALKSHHTRSPTLYGSLSQSGIEQELVHHLFNYWFSIIVLPTCSRGQFMQNLSELVDMMRQCQAVKYAVLACCASNKRILLDDPRYQIIALRHYTLAVHELNQALIKFQPGSDSPQPSLLTIVIFLYVHDLWSLDASSDPRNHVAGAVKLLDLLCHDNNPPASMDQGFNRIIVESILYQAFLLSTRRPFAPYFYIDQQFISRAERLIMPPDSPNWISEHPPYTPPSPVLGVPTSLYRLKLDIINFLNSPTLQNPERLALLRCKMDYWEGLIILKETPRLLPTSPTSTFDLVILATSLLLDLVTESFTHQLPIDLPRLSKSCAHPPRWQIGLCLDILRQPQDFSSFTSCFLGIWPLLILGYTVSSEEDISLIRQALEEMQRRLGYGEVLRLQEELEKVWATKVS